MADQATKITLSGDRELRQLFEELPKRILKKGLRSAMTAAGQPVLRTARASARKESGLLKKAMNKKIKTWPGGNVSVIIGANRAVQGEFKGRKRVPANYIALVAKGTKPHAEPNNPHLKNHPGSEGDDFLHKAYESQKSAAIAIASDKLKTVLEAEAAKLARLK